MKGWPSLLLVLAVVAVAVPHEATGADGAVLLGELNCTACHAATERQREWLIPKSGPRLTNIAERADPEWIQRHLAAPHSTLPGSTMPDLLHGDADKAEALTHYLVSLSSKRPARIPPDRAAVARGEKLYHGIGCVACHAPLNSPATFTASAGLPNLVEKWTFDGLRRFLKDPLATRPSGRMPSMNLTDGEASDIAHYLLRETKAPAALEVAQFRGRVRSFEELDSAEMLRTGGITNFTLAAMGRDRGYALRFSGWLRVDRPGDYTFHLAATGAARLALGGRWVLGEESWQRESVAGSHTIRLETGRHPISVDFVQRGQREPALKVEWEGPETRRGVIASDHLSSTREPVAEHVPFVVDAGKASKGRALFAQLNCAACHEPAGPSSKAGALSDLRPDRGCLAEMPQGTAPDYHLDPARRAQLRTALLDLNRRDLAAPTARQRLADTMASFNCSACHKRDGKGGVASDRDAFFTSNGEDLGDEGRIPPRLDGVGDKLRPEWLAGVMTGGATVRPYLNTRMPQFGPANVGHVAGLFVELDRRAQPVPAIRDAPDLLREAGRTLVGTEGLSCIACHRFNRQPAHAMQLIDLATTPARLNEDWFNRFLRDPERFNTGTRMPAFWPDGVSPLPNLLGGDTARQHAALWAYLGDGPRAKFPEGLSRQGVELVVGGEAVVYRGKLWEAGFRAVAVGYPEQVNIAFDAEEMRLALLWRGRFLNAGAHWNVQGMGQIRPLGGDVVVFPHGPAFATLADDKALWPTNAPKELGAKFRGYQLDALKRPTLLHSFRGIDVAESFAGSILDGKTSIRRTMTFAGSAPDRLHLRIASGRLAPSGNNAWRLDDLVTIRVDGGTTALVRTSGGQQELLVPIRLRDGKGRLEVDYAW